MADRKIKSVEMKLFPFPADLKKIDSEHWGIVISEKGIRDASPDMFDVRYENETPIDHIQIQLNAIHDTLIKHEVRIQKLEQQRKDYYNLPYDSEGRYLDSGEEEGI